MQNKPNNNQPTNRVPTKFTNICTTIPTLIIINSTSNITNTLTLTDTIVQRHYHTVIMSCLWTIIYNNITVTSISMIILTLRCISQRTEAREMYNKLINKVPATKNNQKTKYFNHDLKMDWSKARSPRRQRRNSGNWSRRWNDGRGDSCWCAVGDGDEDGD